MLILSSSRFAQHVTPPGHPERVERAHVFDDVASRWRDAGGRVESPEPADTSDLTRVHAPTYVERLSVVARGPAMLDSDTFTSPQSYDVALLAAGASIRAAFHVNDAAESCLALVRPPGHHAERASAMGFCLFNNVAVAAAALLARGFKRVAIVDIDVHHGNGTQAIFYDDPRVLYISTHQYPFYPGTGSADEVGVGPGQGFTVNVPMEAGANDGDYAMVYDAVVLPVLDAFDAEVTIVSAGFDADENDPLASMRMTAAGFAYLFEQLKTVATNRCLAIVTEGGYDLPALARALEAVVGVVGRDEAGGVPASNATGRGARAIVTARQAQQGLWKIP